VFTRFAGHVKMHCAASAGSLEPRIAGASMFSKVLVANRGAVAARVLRALDELGVRSAALYSEADAGAPWLAAAGESHLVGPPAARASYLNQEAILSALERSGADALHPGYGFLSENAEFAAAVEAAGARFIGPSPRWIAAMGHKTEARQLMAGKGLPIGGGSAILGSDPDSIRTAARALGYPVLVKPAGGGGGIGMLAVHDEADLLAAVERARSLAQRNFGNDEVYLERLVLRPRHIEFQVLGDREGSVRHLFERDCSLQRRHQKIVEEAPAPGLARGPVEAMAQSTAEVLGKLGYDNIGTVEMLREGDGAFSFLEMNTRLQVEHAVTEAVTGVDLVQAQIRAAAGERLGQILPDVIPLNGHAIEARVYAEHPVNFLPSPGPLKVFRPPHERGVRIETGYAEGNVVTPHYDPLLAKVIAHGASRSEAIARLRAALGDFAVEGVRTNLPFLLNALASDDFVRGEIHTGLALDLVRKQKS
jgi:acetyl-CoA carboxylase biotin carboxylase subunit